MRVLLMLITFLAISVPAKADLWRTYQVPDTPDFIFALPESYTFIYHDMPIDESIPLTLKQVNSLLDFHDSFALAFSNDYTKCIMFAKSSNEAGIEYDALSDDELFQLGNEMCRLMSEYDSALTNINMSYDNNYILHSDHNTFVFMEGNSKTESMSQYTAIYSSCFKDCELIVSVSYYDDELPPADKELFDAIVSSIIHIE